MLPKPYKLTLLKLKLFILILKLKINRLNISRNQKNIVNCFNIWFDKYSKKKKNFPMDYSKYLSTKVKKTVHFLGELENFENDFDYWNKKYNENEEFYRKITKKNDIK